MIVGVGTDLCGIGRIARAMENERFDCLHPRLVSELKARAQSLDLSDSVLVHGDCTGENLLVNDGQPILIDFADCCLAPAWYELPAAVGV